MKKLILLTIMGVIMANTVVAQEANVELLSIALIAKHEGFRATPYRCPGGHLTIGYGFSDPKLVAKGSMTVTEADRILGVRVREEIKWVNKTFPLIKKPKQVAAIVSLAYNLGHDTLLWKVENGKRVRTDASLYLQKGDLVKAAPEIKEFRLAGGKVAGGLVKRRAEEVKWLLA